MSSERVRIDWDAARRELQAAEAALEKALRADPARIEHVYRDRALQMAGRQTQTASNGGTIRALVFSLGAETYGIAISDLAEVLPDTRSTPVPRAAAEIVGVINLRGELRSVIDLRRLLALPSVADDSTNCILMLRNGPGEVGLKVGRVERVQTLQVNELAEIGATEGSSAFASGLSPDKVILLDAAALRLHSVFRNVP